MKKLLIVVVIVFIAILFSVSSSNSIRAEWCEDPDELPGNGLVCP